MVSRKRGFKGARLGNWLTGILGVIFIAFAGAKIFGASSVVSVFNNYGGIMGLRIVIGFGLLIGSFLFLIPSTFSLGVLVLSSFWGGAIAVHMFLEESFLIANVFLILVWVAFYLKRPDMIRKNIS